MIYVLNNYSSKSTEHFYHVLNLLENIAEKGVKIALVIEKADDIPETSSANIQVICQTQKNSFFRGIELFYILKRLIRKGYNRTFIRISINSTLIAIIANKIHKGKVYYWQSGTTYNLDKEKLKKNKIKWFLSKYIKWKLLIDNVDYFVTGPQTMLEYYHKEVNVKKEKLKLLYNDINLERFNPVDLIKKDEIRKELSLPLDKLIILVVHRLSPVRKTDYYLPYIINKKVFDNKNAQIIVIGEGPEKEGLLNEVKSKNYEKYIKFIGAKPNSDIEKYYRAANIFLNPSYTEGFPRVIIEAMASGLPVVSTDAGGTRDLFESLQNDFVSAKEDRDKLKENLTYLLNNYNLKDNLVAENIQKVKEFSTEQVSEMYIKELFNE